LQQHKNQTMTSWRSKQPYNDLQALPPVVELKTRLVLKASMAERAALVLCNRACGG
jgi:hypothetical protein